ncbi:hypothetical protein [Dokdonia sp. Hel_I_53]|uniref:hypothetical protein n=1 Tax=Dokdonia sp. Hel_I_53 TaxID=1566287 RepID=UPI001198E0B1|nr:hypothetical protein [Dokdonia sp. Hel_I_53]TVZ52192.1 hypothetical protein OD90_1362 [Dokdonia sp. Hel_I_53]
MNKYDKIGIILLLIGVALYFVQFGYLIGFPIYLIGIFILLLGNLKIKHKLLWILAPAVLLFSYINLASPLFSVNNKVDLIIPDDFRGNAIIIDNTDFGQNLSLNQIIFDENGIAFYPTDLELGISKFRVYTKQKNGELKRILWSFESSDKVTILGYGKSSFKKNIDSEIKYVPYDYVQIGENFVDQNNSEKRCELIELIKKGELKTVYNNCYRQ